MNTDLHVRSIFYSKFTAICYHHYYYYYVYSVFYYYSLLAIYAQPSVFHSKFTVICHYYRFYQDYYHFDCSCPRHLYFSRLTIICYYYYYYYYYNCHCSPSMFAAKAKIYGVLYNPSSSLAFDETSSYWSAPKSSKFSGFSLVTTR